MKAPPSEPALAERPGNRRRQCRARLLKRSPTYWQPSRCHGHKLLGLRAAGSTRGLTAPLRWACKPCHCFRALKRN